MENLLSDAIEKFDLSACGCGRVHKLHTKKIIVGDDAFSEILNVFDDYAPQGSRVLFINDSNIQCHDEVRRLISKKYRVSDCTVAGMKNDRSFAEDVVIPEDAKLIACYGGGSVADVAKYVATKHRLPLIMIGASQSTSGYLAASSMLLNGGFTEVYKVLPPDAFIMDTARLSGDCNINAAGFGEICSRLTALFDWEFAHVLKNESYCKSIEKYVLLLISDTIKKINSFENETAKIIAASVIKLSLLLQYTGDSRLMCGGDMQIFHALKMLYAKKGLEFKLQGENEMLISGIAIKTYLAMFGCDDFGFTPPPDNNMRMDALVNNLGLSYKTAYSKIRPYVSYAELCRFSHCLNECRDELLFKLKTYEKILAGANKTFKRLYNDKGYSYNEYIAASDLALCIGLAPDVREKFTTLSYMKHLGVLDRYIS